MNETLLRELHSSLCVTWGTTAPFKIGKVRAEQVGFARIPRVVVEVITPYDALDGLVPVVRQRVFAELAERGWDNESIEFRPGVRTGRRRKFVDENESSESFGKNKFGEEHEFGFDMRPELARATFPLGAGTYAQLPVRRDS